MTFLSFNTKYFSNLLFLLFSISCYSQKLFPVYSSEDNSIYIELQDLDLPESQYEELTKTITSKPTDFNPIILNQRQKETIFKVANITTEDTFFYYNYSNNKLLSWNCQEAILIATKDPFFDFYNMGLLIKDEELSKNKKSLTNAFVSIEKENPFIEGQIHPIKWNGINTHTFPIPLSFINELESYTSTPWSIQHAYKYQEELNDFYLAELTTDDYQYAHILVITKKDTDIVLFTKLFQQGETYALSTVKQQYDIHTFPWTGKLLKNKPLAFWDFYDSIVGCPSIYFNDGSELEITCINNH